MECAFYVSVLIYSVQMLGFAVEQPNSLLELCTSVLFLLLSPVHILATSSVAEEKQLKAFQPLHEPLHQEVMKTLGKLVF